MRRVKEREAQKSSREEYKVFIEFLKRTKDGEYAPIEKTSLPYVRIEVESETIESYEEEYYYSLR